MRVMKIAAICLLPSLATASDSLQEQLRQCRVEINAAQRLACYDALPLASVAARAPGLRSTDQSAATAKTPSTPGRVESGTAVGAARRQVDGFGLPMPAPAPPPVTLQSIESVIDGRFLGWSPGSSLRLRNGQTWQVIDDSAAAYDLANPKVVVEKGRFGGHFMRIEGVGQTPRVRRVQ